jgi:hypothetical protein
MFKINGGKPPKEDNDMIEITDQFQVIYQELHYNHIAIHQELPLIAIIRDNQLQIWEINTLDLSVRFMHIIEMHLDEKYTLLLCAFHPTEPNIAVVSQSAISYESHISIKLYSNIHQLETNALLCNITPDQQIMISNIVFHRTLSIIALNYYNYGNELTDEIDNFSQSSGKVEIWNITPNIEPIIITTIGRKSSFGYERWGTPYFELNFHYELPIIAVVKKRYYPRENKIFLFYINMYAQHRENQFDDNVRSQFSRLTRELEPFFSCDGHHVSFYKYLHMFVTVNENILKIWNLQEELYLPHIQQQPTCVMTHEFDGLNITNIALHPTILNIAVENINMQSGLSEILMYSISNISDLWTIHYDKKTPERERMFQDFQDIPSNLFFFHAKLPLLFRIFSFTFAKTFIIWHTNIEYSNFIIHTNIRDVEINIHQKLCPLCNLHLCIQNPLNNNDNINGYVVNLIHMQKSNNAYIHYTCVYRSLLNNSFEYNIKSEIRDKLLNIDDKVIALRGTDFYK